MVVKARNGIIRICEKRMWIIMQPDLVGLAQAILMAPNNHADLDDFVQKNDLGMSRDRSESYELAVRNC